MTTAEELKNEKQKHLDQISRIETQIEVEVSFKRPVNEHYGRINVLYQRILEIDNVLSVQTPPKGNTSREQAEKGQALAGAGGVFIRPSQQLINPGQEQKTETQGIPERHSISADSKQMSFSSVHE